MGRDIINYGGLPRAWTPLGCPRHYDLTCIIEQCAPYRIAHRVPIFEATMCRVAMRHHVTVACGRLPAASARTREASIHTFCMYLCTESAKYQPHAEREFASPTSLHLFRRSLREPDGQNQETLLDHQSRKLEKHLVHYTRSGGLLEWPDDRVARIWTEHRALAADSSCMCTLVPGPRWVGVCRIKDADLAVAVACAIGGCGAGFGMGDRYGMDVRVVLAACVLCPALSEFRASGHSVRFGCPALEQTKPFLCARKIDCAGVMRLFNMAHPLGQ